MTTWELNEIADGELKQLKARARPFLGYHGYPAVALHVGQRGGRPRHPAQGRGAQGRRHPLDRLRRLQGRLVRRLGAHRRRSARSRAEAEALMDATRESLDRAIDAVRAGQPPGGHRLGRPVATSSSAATRWCGSSSGTASAAHMHEEPAGPELRRRRARAAALRPGWCSPSSPWSTPGRPGGRSSRTTGGRL